MSKGWGEKGKGRRTYGILLTSVDTLMPDWHPVRVGERIESEKKKGERGRGGDPII